MDNTKKEEYIKEVLASFNLDDLSVSTEIIERIKEKDLCRVLEKKDGR